MLKLENIYYEELQKIQNLSKQLVYTKKYT